MLQQRFPFHFGSVFREGMYRQRNSAPATRRSHRGGQLLPRSCSCPPNCIPLAEEEAETAPPKVRLEPPSPAPTATMTGTSGSVYKPRSSSLLLPTVNADDRSPTASLVATRSNRFESLLRHGSFLLPKFVSGNESTIPYLLQEITDHSIGVNCLELSDDHSLLVSGGEDGTVRLWSTFSDPCECIGVLVGHKSYVTCCAVYRYAVISGSADTTVRIWRIEDGECVMVLCGHCRVVNRCACFGPLLLTAAFDNTVRVWALTDRLVVQNNYRADDNDEDQFGGETLVTRQTVATQFGQCLFALEGHTKSITQVAIWSNDLDQFQQGVIQELDLVITTSTDGTAQTYNLASGGELRHILIGHDGPINCLAMDAKEARFVYTAGADSVIKNWDIITGEFIRDLAGHEGSVLCLISYNRILYSGSVDQTVRAWAMEFGQCTRVYHQNTAPVTCLQYFRGILYTGCNDNCARLYDSNSAVLKATFAGHSNSISALKVVQGKLFTASFDGRIMVWDCRHVQAQHGGKGKNHRRRSSVRPRFQKAAPIRSANKSSRKNNDNDEDDETVARKIRQFYETEIKSGNNGFRCRRRQAGTYEDDDGCLAFARYCCCWWRRTRPKPELQSLAGNQESKVFYDDEQHTDNELDSENVREALQSLEPILRSFR